MIEAPRPRETGRDCRRGTLPLQRDWYFIAEHPAPAPHPANPEGCVTLRIVLVTVPRVSRSCENCPDGFDLYLPLLPIHLQGYLAHKKPPTPTIMQWAYT